MNKPKIIPYNPKLVELAKHLRKNSTKSEVILWNYLKAKKKFFDDMPKNAFSLTNLDDKNGLVMTQNTRSKVYTYSLRSLSDFKGRVIESHFEGMLLDFNNHELAVQFIDKFNASNLLAVFGAAVFL